jgi:hypothetical protein
MAGPLLAAPLLLKAGALFKGVGAAKIGGAKLATAAKLSKIGGFFKKAKIGKTISRFGFAGARKKKAVATSSRFGSTIGGRKVKSGGLMGGVSRFAGRHKKKLTLGGLGYAGVRVAQSTANRLTKATRRFKKPLIAATAAAGALIAVRKWRRNRQQKKAMKVKKQQMKL